MLRLTLSTSWRIGRTRTVTRMFDSPAPDRKLSPAGDDEEEEEEEEADEEEEENTPDPSSADASTAVPEANAEAEVADGGGVEPCLT